MNFCFVIDELLAASSQPGKNRRLPAYLDLYKENEIRVLYSLHKKIELPREYKSYFKSYLFKIDDYEIPSLNDLDVIVNTIIKHLKKKEPVNVNCSTGIGKSSLIITAVIMKYQNLPLKETLKRVMEHRYVSLEDGVRELLLHYEELVVVKEELEAAS